MSFTSRRLVFAISAKAVSFLGNGLADVALTLRLQPHGAAVVAALLACNLLPIVLLSGMVGRLVDAVGERTLLLVSGLAQAAVCVVLAGLSTPAGIFVAVALLGAGQAVNAATWQAVLPALAPPGRLAWAMSRSQAATMLAGIVAPALGGLLVFGLGTGAPLLVDALTFLALAHAGLLLGTVRVAADRGDGRVGGLTVVRSSPVLRATIGLLATVVVLGSMVNVVEVFLVRSTLHSGALAYGLTGAAYSVGALLGAVWAGGLTTTRHQARVLLHSMTALGIGLAAMGLAPTVAWLIAASVLTGVTNGVLNVAAASLVLGAVPAGRRGRVGALQNGALSAAQLVAYAMSAALATVLDPRAIFVLGGALAALAPVLAGRRLRRATGLRVAHGNGKPGNGPHGNGAHGNGKPGNGAHGNGAHGNRQDAALSAAIREMTLHRTAASR